MLTDRRGGDRCQRIGTTRDPETTADLAAEVFDRLPDHERQAIHSHVVDGRSYREAVLLAAPAGSCRR